MFLSRICAVLFLASLSCGLPDTFILLDSPVVSVSSVNTTKISATVSTDLGVTQYGLIVFYKIYPAGDANAQLEADLEKWNTRLTEDQVNVARTLDFRVITLDNRPETAKDTLPVFDMGSSGDYETNFTCSPNIIDHPFFEATKKASAIVAPIVQVKIARYNLKNFFPVSNFSSSDIDIGGKTIGTPVSVAYIVMAYKFISTIGNIYSAPVKLKVSTVS